MTTYKIQPGLNQGLTQITPASARIRQHHWSRISVTTTPVVTTGSVTLRQSRHFRMRVGKSTASTTGAAKLRQNKANLFKHFAHYDVGGVDPAMALVAASTKGVAAYDSTTPSNFRRVSAAVVVPNDYPVSNGYAWPQASFVGVGARVKSMAVGNYALLDATQVEMAKNGTTAPSAYAPARALVCNVRPNRLNLANDPRAVQFQAIAYYVGWRSSRWFGSGAAAGTYSTRTGQVDGPLGLPTYARKTWTTAPTVNNQDTGFDHAISAAQGFPVTPGVTLSLSSYLRSSASNKLAASRVRWYNSAGTWLSDSVGPRGFLAAGQWQRVSAVHVAPANAAYAQPISDIYDGTGSTLWAVGDTLDGTGLLLEYTNVVGDYFDGNSGNDYLWEQQATPANTGRSFYYKNYLTRSYILRQILAENSPLGTTPAIPQFGIMPLT